MTDQTKLEVTAAGLRFHSFFVESPDIQKTMRDASEILEKMLRNKQATVQIKRKPRKVKAPKVIAGNTDWIKFTSGLSTRASNALKKTYGLRVPSVDEWAAKVTRKKLSAITNMGALSVKQIEDALKARGLELKP